MLARARSKASVMAAQAAWQGGLGVLGQGQGLGGWGSCAAATAAARHQGEWSGSGNSATSFPSNGWAAGLHSSSAPRSQEDAAASAAEAATTLHFTPDAAAAGGALVGLAAAAKLGFTGRILGVSGIVGGLVRGGWGDAWRYSWLGGLAAGALAMGALHPEGFFVFPESYSLARAASGGDLVGGVIGWADPCEWHCVRLYMHLCLRTSHGLAGMLQLMMLAEHANCLFANAPPRIRSAGRTGHLPGQRLYLWPRRVWHCSAGAPLTSCHRCVCRGGWGGCQESIRAVCEQHATSCAPPVLPVGTFMASGVATAALAGSLAATGVDVTTPATLQLMSGSEQWQLATPLLGGSLATVALLRGSALAGGNKSALNHAAEFTTGAIFAAGLALSGMCMPSKVAG